MSELDGILNHIFGDLFMRGPLFLTQVDLPLAVLCQEDGLADAGEHGGAVGDGLSGDGVPCEDGDVDVGV